MPLPQDPPYIRAAKKREAPSAEKIRQVRECIATILEILDAYDVGTVSLQDARRIALGHSFVVSAAREFLSSFRIERNAIVFVDDLGAQRELPLLA
jgi:hypothetical protein